MQLKTSYFNPTLFRKNLMRFWPLWGGVSALGALAPLCALAALIHEGFRSHSMQPLEMTAIYYEVLHYAVPIISLLYGVLCALAVWNYLYNHRSVSLYHALPITRKGLFITNVLSGLAMMLIPYAVTGGLMILISLLGGLFEPVGVLVTVLGVLGLSFFYFAAATLIAFVTGNPFAFAAFYFIFHFLAAAAEWLVMELMSQFYYGVSSTYQGVLDFLSPTVFFLDDKGLNTHTEFQDTVSPDGWVERTFESVTLENGWVIAVYALAGVALLGCAWLLYRRRRSECAGDVVAVGWMKPVFRYGVALCAAVTGGTLLYHLFFNSFQKGSTVMPLPMAVCMAAAGLVGYYIASMLLAKSFHVFRGSWKGALASVAAAGAVCAVIALDPAGVKSWRPEAGNLESVSLSLSSDYGRGISADIADPAAIQKVLDLHGAILEEEQQLDSDGNRYGQAYLGYWLRDSGKHVTRYYSFHYSDDLQSKALEQLRELACDPAVQEANIFPLSRNSSVTARVTGGYVEEVYNSQTREFENLELTPDQARELEAAVLRDIRAGHFGKTFLADSGEEEERAVYRGKLSFYYSITRKATEVYSGETYGDSESVVLSIYCTETLQALEKMGLLDGTRRLMTRMEYQTMRQAGDVQDGGYPDEYDEYLYEYTAYSHDTAGLGGGYAEPADGPDSDF